MDGAQPLAGISSVTGESSGRPAAMHQSAASSTGRSEPGSASSAANLRRAPRSLKGGRSAAEKRQDRFKHRRVYQTTESYKAKRRLRENGEKYRFAKNARRTFLEYKERKKVYEGGEKAKASRSQKKWIRFWTPCFFNWTGMRKHRDVQADNNAAAYAPHLHEDGRISVRQNGTVVFLPCPDEPAAGAGHQQLEEFRLALALRCRIGAINCRRVVDGIGCCSRWIRKEIAEARELRRIGEGCCDPSAPASGSAGRPRDNFESYLSVGASTPRGSIDLGGSAK